MRTNGTKLTLEYDIISGPYGNVNIQTKIDGKPEKLPFESIYLKESPFEVLKNLGINYEVNEYKNLEISSISRFEFKKHNILYGLSIKESNLEGATIHNKIKDVNLSFLPKLKLHKEESEERVKGLIGKYIVITHTEYGPIFQTNMGLESSDIEVTENYFQDRENKKEELKEKQLSQILEYAQAILDKPKFSIKNLEEMVSERAVAI